ncbi:MAG TPA: cbb3-type cytochrome c oxidase subunit 3 [Patescibacteria group bacterium]|nr:cbb3-type cytochrome c oxidase subunit 3 [Patescibacteria group bacterium]
MGSKKIILTFLPVFLFLFLISYFLSLTLAGAASPATQIINGFKQTGDAAGYDVNKQTGAPQKEFVEAWSIYLNGFAAIFGAFFMVLAIYGGWLWMTAQGKEEQIERAKKIIIGALIGLAVIIGGRLMAELALFYLAQTVPF